MIFQLSYRLCIGISFSLLLTVQVVAYWTNAYRTTKIQRSSSSSSSSSLFRPNVKATTPTTTNAKSSLLSRSMVGDAGGYYGQAGSSFMVREFNMYEDLQEIVQLASLPIPERPDGIVCVVKYTSSTREECRINEADYERMARDNPSTIFLRAFKEYDNSNVLFGKVDVQTFPCFDIYYKGNRVARVEGSDLSELEKRLNMYQFQNSKLDLFSEMQREARQWGVSDRMAKDLSAMTPKTTNRFVPGYDWNKKTGLMDDEETTAFGGKVQQQSFEDAYENNWLPTFDDDDDDDDDDNE